MRITIVASALALLAGLAMPAASKPLNYKLPEETEALRPGTGPGFEAAQNNCLACHSADYVRMQPPHRGKAFWDAEVTKMIKVYQAPISPDDAKVSGDYLANAY